VGFYDKLGQLFYDRLWIIATSRGSSDERRKEFRQWRKKTMKLWAGATTRDLMEYARREAQAPIFGLGSLKQRTPLELLKEAKETRVRCQRKIENPRCW